MKKILYIFSFLVLAVHMHAQQYPLFTNYALNRYAYNPAYTGTVGCLDAQAVYRTQWVGFENSPITKALSVNKMLKKVPLGIGAMFIDDQAGQLKRTGVNFNLAYLANRDKNMKFSFGVSGGGHNLRLADGLNLENSNDPLMGLLGGKNWLFDLGFGVMAFSDKMYIGVSSPQLSYSKLNFNESEDGNLARLQRHFYLMGGYKMKLTEKFDIEPSAMIKYEKSAPLQIDLSAKLTFKKMLWVGVSYRHEAALAGLLGVNYKNFVFGYAYDFNLVGFGKSGFSSHEFSLGYTVKCKISGKDSDNDGIADDEDECPEVAGTIKGKGCPELDSDNDGIVDSEDECPDLPGTTKGKGCPDNDRDKDGIVDDLDKCPDVAGIVGGKGCPYIDSDGDGVKDSMDACPNISGDPSNNGCPSKTNITSTPVTEQPFRTDVVDTDGDSWADYEDKCPNVYGTIDGCPEPVDADRDKDGIINELDNCPDVWGVSDNNGCPVAVDNDSDKDGVSDDKDRCPNIWGDINNDGCPTVVNNDFDNDGITDNDDDCPNTWGVANNRGCPILTEHHMSVLKMAIKHVYFDTDKSILKAESKKYLKDLAKVMQKQIDWKVRVTGYADPRGTEEHNLMLSRDRAFAVADYMTSQGIPRSRFIIEYFGEEDPKGVFINEDVLQQSRRVQLEYVFN